MAAYLADTNVSGSGRDTLGGGDDLAAVETGGQ
jgi:hypothetical protein